ncbi:hypothetical protein D3C76_1516760 [compost metagenome]
MVICTELFTLAVWGQVEKCTTPGKVGKKSIIHLYNIRCIRTSYLRGQLVKISVPSGVFRFDCNTGVFLFKQFDHFGRQIMASL